MTCLKPGLGEGALKDTAPATATASSPLETAPFLPIPPGFFLNTVALHGMSAGKEGIAVSTTMGPGLKVDVASLAN